MQSILKFSKRTVLFSVVSLGLLLAIGLFIFARTGRNAPNGGSVCKTSEYSQVHTGMTKNQVTELWGKPHVEREKHSTNENFFYQGANEANIKEGWIYRPSGQPDSAEIYFDTTGLVNGKNCGQG